MNVKNKLFNKYVLYVICFVILNVFDVLREMQFASLQIGQRYIRLEDVLPGYKMADIWLIVENSIGLIMMLVVLSGYEIKKFITKINLVWTGLCVAAMIVLPYIRTGKYGTILIQEEIAIINIWWIVLVAKQICVKAIREKKNPIKFNWLTCLWIAITLCMFLSVAPTNIWPIFYLGMFGCFYLTKYKKGDIKRLFEAMLDGSILAFVLLQTVACLLRPYDIVRYPMLYSDCNRAAAYYLIIYVMILAKLHLTYIRNAKRSVKIGCVVGQGCTLVLMFMTGCRTVWVTAIVVTVLYGIFVVKILWKQKWSNVIHRGIVLVITIVIMFYPTYWIIRWTPTIVPARLWYSTEFDRLPREVLVGESKYSEKYVDLGELLRLQLGRFSRMLPFDEENKTVASVVEKDSSVNERFSIYRMYYEELTWYGNNPSAQKNYEMRYHAHNLYLQIAYFYGIPAGILLIVIAIGLLGYHGYKVLKYKDDCYVIIPFMVCVIFFCSGLMNVVWVTGQFMLFLLFFTQYPLGNDTDKIEGKCSESKG